jgi:hypothetical protein
MFDSSASSSSLSIVGFLFFSGIGLSGNAKLQNNLEKIRYVEAFSSNN